MSRTVVTGQQIGLLGGPLYTILKVLGAVRQAEEIGGRAVYWLETNDADFAEINHLDFIDAAGNLRQLRWDKDSGGLSCGGIEVDDALVDLLNRFFEALQPTEHTARLRHLALSAYAPGRPLGRAAREVAAALFKDFTLELFDPMDPDFRRATRDILLREARRTAAGGQCNLFGIVDGRRVALFRTDTGYVDRAGHPVDVEAVDLVPNVRTRSVIQDFYFGTHTYVAGPGEVAYLGGLGDVYGYHRVTPARIRHRMSVRLIEPRARRLIEKLGVAVEDLEGVTRDAFVNGLMSRISGFDAREIQDRAVQRVDAFLEDLDSLGLQVKEIRRLLLPAVKRELGLRRAEEKKRLGQRVEKAGFLYDLMRPNGRPQERVFNGFYYMNLYGGDDFIRLLYRNYRFGPEVTEVELG